MAHSVRTHLKLEQLELQVWPFFPSNNMEFSVTFVFCICLRAASAYHDKSRLLEPFLSVCNEMLKLISRSAGTRAFKITLSEEKLITFFMLCNAVISVFTDS